MLKPRWNSEWLSPCFPKEPWPALFQATAQTQPSIFRLPRNFTCIFAWFSSTPFKHTSFLFLFWRLDGWLGRVPAACTCWPWRGELEACQKPVTLGTKYWRFVHVKHNCEMLHEILIYWIVDFRLHLSFFKLKNNLQCLVLLVGHAIITTSLLKIIMSNVRVISMKFYVLIINH